MENWRDLLTVDCELPDDADEQLRESGFVIIPGPVPPEGMSQLARAYDSVVASAATADISTGRSTTRVQDFVNRGATFDRLYVFPPLLSACCRVIGQPFKLSTMHARTVRPYVAAQDLHVDFKYDVSGFPMVGFILMVDAFRPDNGATRFVPGSHRWSTNPEDSMSDGAAHYEGQLLACGPSGSMIIYNGSVWHGHAANSSSEPRRSIQGAYIRREALSGANLLGRMTPETLARISPIAKYLLDV